MLKSPFGGYNRDTKTRRALSDRPSLHDGDLVRELWLLVIPVFLLMWLIWSSVAPAIFQPLSPEEISKLTGEFREYRPAAGLLALRYELLVASVLLGYLGFLGARGSRTAGSTESNPGRLILTLFVQTALGVAIVFFSLQEHQLHLKFFERPLYPLITPLGIGTVIVFGLTLVAAVRFRETHRISKIRDAGPWLAPSIAFGYCALSLISGVYNERFVAGIDSEVTGHASYMMDELLFSLVGKTSLVDYFPVYQNLMAYFYQPFFQVFGANVLTFTVVNTLLAGLIFALIYRVIASFSQGPWKTLCLFLPFVAFAFFPKAQFDGTELVYYPIRYNNFTYPLLSSARYLGPFLLLFLLLVYAKKPTRIRRAAALFVASGVAINNADFGLAAFLSLLCAFGAAEILSGQKSLLRRVAAFALEVAVSALACVAIFAGFCWLRSGALPQLDWLAFPFLIGKIGGLYIEKPEWGYQWIVALMLVVGVVTGFLRLRRTQTEARTVDGLGLMLAYVGSLGLTTMPYYLGSAYDENLPALFPFLGLVIVFLMIHSLRGAKDFRSVFRPAENRLPLAALLSGYLIMAANLTNVDSPAMNLRRFLSPAFSAADDVIYEGALEKLPAFMRENADPQRPALIMIRFGNIWAYRFGLRDLVPNPVGNDLLRLQGERTLEIIRRNPDVLVYARKQRPGKKAHAFKIPIRNLLIEQGFKNRSKDPDFELWAKD